MISARIKSMTKKPQQKKLPNKITGARTRTTARIKQAAAPEKRFSTEKRSGTTRDSRIHD
jgi:ribosomal protein S17E